MPTAVGIIFLKDDNENVTNSDNRNDSGLAFRRVRRFISMTSALLVLNETSKLAILLTPSGFSAFADR
jgi:hypothetical protein